MFNFFNEHVCLVVHSIHQQEYRKQKEDENPVEDAQYPDKCMQWPPCLYTLGAGDVEEHLFHGSGKRLSSDVLLWLQVSRTWQGRARMWLRGRLARRGHARAETAANFPQRCTIQLLFALCVLAAPRHAATRIQRGCCIAVQDLFNGGGGISILEIPRERSWGRLARATTL